MTEEERLRSKREELLEKLRKGDKITIDNGNNFTNTDAAPKYERISIPTKSISFSVHFPAEIELLKGEGYLYGYKFAHYTYGNLWGAYFITSNVPYSARKPGEIRLFPANYIQGDYEFGHEEIGKIYKEQPAEYLDELTGFYENGELHFVFGKKGVPCLKEPYSLFESWLNGKIDIKYNL